MAFEKWLPVVGHEGLYEVSDFGRVRRMESAFYWRPTEKILGPRYNIDGYLVVSLRPGHKDKNRNWRVHQLVMQAFIGPCPPEHLVDHKDGDRANNMLGNLRYLYWKENNRKKLSHQQVAEIRRLYLEGVGQKELAQVFGVRPNMISRIVNFVRRQYIPTTDKEI